MKTDWIFALLFYFFFSSSFEIKANRDYNWWPPQKKPEKVYVCSFHQDDANLAQSLSGVVAQGLNEDLTTDGIWLKTNVEGYDIYLDILLKSIKNKTVDELDVWSLIEKYHKSGLIKGYVLYDNNREDYSINLATVKCGILKALMVDLSQEQRAIETGLVKLDDVTNVTPLTDAAFGALSAQLNPNLLVLANPKHPHNRDYAIAHKAMVHYGVNPLLETILSWMEPLSPIIGWNEGPEFDHIAPCSYWGMINTASDWCVNLPLISATPKKIGKSYSLNPQKIKWKEKKNYHSYVMSDGDNMQWSFSSFIHSPEYLSNPYNSELSMSYTTCAVNLAMSAQPVWHTIVSKQPKNTTLIEYGGGYYYPDLFAIKRSNPDSLLRQLAKIVNDKMVKTGVNILGFICEDIYSPQATKAYQIFAEEVPSLVGILVVQYHPYNRGLGNIIWVKNTKGESIPIVSPHYQIWANLDGEGSGNPSSISQLINQSALKRQSTYSWSIVHAWSNYKLDRNNDIIDLKTKEPQSQRGVTPLKWGSEHLKNNVKLITIEELLWRIRMENNPQETGEIIRQLYNK